MRAYQQLINAAQYMRRRVKKIGNFIQDEELANCFPWSDTPQGHKYWWNIEKKIEEN